MTRLGCALAVVLALVGQLLLVGVRAGGGAPLGDLVVGGEEGLRCALAVPGADKDTKERDWSRVGMLNRED